MFVYPATNLNGIHSCGTVAGFGISFCGVDIIMEQSPVPDGDLSLPILFESEGNNCTIGSTPQTKDICLSPSTNSPTSTNSTSLKPTKSPIATTKNPTRSPIIKTPTKSPITNKPTSKNPTKSPTPDEKNGSLSRNNYQIALMVTLFLSFLIFF